MPVFELMDQGLLILHEFLDVESVFFQHQRRMIHSYVMRQYDVVGTLFVELDRFVNMIGYEDDDQIRIILFGRFEQDYIFIKSLYRADDHFAVSEIQFLEEIDIADIAVDAWDLPFLEMGDDPWMFIDDEDVLMRFMERRIDITSESSVSEDHYLVIFLIDFFVFFLSNSRK